VVTYGMPALPWGGAGVPAAYGGLAQPMPATVTASPAGQMPRWSRPPAVYSQAMPDRNLRHPVRRYGSPASYAPAPRAVQRPPRYAAYHPGATAPRSMPSSARRTAPVSDAQPANPGNYRFRQARSQVQRTKVYRFAGRDWRFRPQSRLAAQSTGEKWRPLRSERRSSAPALAAAATADGAHGSYPAGPQDGAQIQRRYAPYGAYRASFPAREDCQPVIWVVNLSPGLHTRYSQIPATAGPGYGQMGYYPVLSPYAG